MAATMAEPSRGTTFTCTVSDSLESESGEDYAVPSMLDKLRALKASALA